MKKTAITFCFVMFLGVSGCAEDSSTFKGPRADMTEKYPKKPFTVKRKTNVFLASGPHFVMPPGLPEVPSVGAAALQRPMKGSGENGAPLAFPPLTDTEATYGH